MEVRKCQFVNAIIASVRVLEVEIESARLDALDETLTRVGLALPLVVMDVVLMVLGMQLVVELGYETLGSPLVVGMNEVTEIPGAEVRMRNGIGEVT